MPSIIDNPELYEKAKRIVYQEYPKHSAYRSGQLVKRYKEMGGTYSGTKPKGGLTSWFKEDWKSIGGDYPTYRPTIRVNKDTPLTASEIDPVQAKKQIALKQKIKGEANLPPFEKKGKGGRNEIYISNYKVKTGGMMPPPPDSPTRGMIISPPPQIISREQMRANVERSRNMFREALAPTGYFAPIDPAGLSSFNQPQIVRPTPVRPTPIRQIQYPITGEDIETANTMLELSKTGRGGGAPMGVDVVDYKIDPEAKKVAKKLGVKIEPSKKKFKKIDVFDLNNQYITSVGDARYNDYRSYIKEKGKEYADTRRRLYKIRHQRNRLVEGSPSYYADQLLW